jgi:copper chaperone CopZ
MSETLRLHVTGMTCGGCENAVKRSLLQLAGVKDVTASHREAMVGVTYDTGKVTPAMIEERIERLGYRVEGS